jgi:hypothetical protein
MFLFYVDECGDDAIKYAAEGPPYVLSTKQSPYFTLSAVGIRDSSRKPLADALFEIKTRHFGKQVGDFKWGDSEIKGRFLNRSARAASNGTALQSPKAYRKLDSPHKVSKLINDLGLLFDKHRPIILSVTVDKARLVKTKSRSDHDALGAAYSLLQERIALSLEKLYTGESAVLIADEQTHHEKFFRSGEMNRKRKRFSGSLKVQPNFDLVVDKPLWLDTDLSSWDRELIQLADIVAYSSQSCVRTGEAPMHESFLWPQITRAMSVHWRTGDIRQAGFTVFPRGKKFYPKIK